MAQDNVEEKKWAEKNQGNGDDDDGSANGSDMSDAGSDDEHMSTSGSEDGTSIGESTTS